MSKVPSRFVSVIAGLLTATGCQVEDFNDGMELSTWSIRSDLGTVMPCRASRTGHDAGVGDVIVLRTLPEYCDIVAVPVVVLQSSERGDHPDPGKSVVMTNDGRYFTSSVHGQQILEWSPEGAFVRAVGSTGEGPGELSPRGALELFLGPGDSLFVLDGAPRWSVFDSDLEFQRSFSAEHNTRDLRAVHVVDGFGILSTANVFAGPSNGASSFHLTDFEGVPVTSFGPREALQSSPPLHSSVRVSTEDRQGGFWVTPPSGSQGSVSFENWSLGGDRLTVLERRAAWYPENGYTTRSGSREPPLPEYKLMYVDHQGFLWASLIVRDARWRPLAGDEQQAMQHELYDVRIEIIDPATATVLASLLHDGPNEEIPPFERFLGQRRSYRIVNDERGFRSIEIYDIHLASR